MRTMRRICRKRRLRSTDVAKMFPWLPADTTATDAISTMMSGGSAEGKYTRLQETGVMNKVGSILGVCFWKQPGVVVGVGVESLAQVDREDGGGGFGRKLPFMSIFIYMYINVIVPHCNKLNQRGRSLSFRSPAKINEMLRFELRQRLFTPPQRVCVHLAASSSYRSTADTSRVAGET